MNENGRNFMIGLVTIVALIAVSSLLLQFGELDRLINPTYDVTIQLNSAGSTRPGSRVTLNGVKIGQVDTVILIDDVKHPVLVKAALDRRHPIPMGTVAIVADSLLGSGGQIEMQMPENRTEETPTLAMDGTAVITGRWDSLGDTIATQLEGQMSPLMSSLDSFNDLASSWTRVGNRVDRMLDPAHSDEPGSVAGAMTDLDGILLEAAEALKLARIWLDDEQLRADISSAAWKANRLLESATTATNNVNQLAESVGNDIDRLTDAALPVAEQMSLTLERLGVLLEQASDGEGTIGQLMSNPDLYRSLEEAAKRLESTMEQLELLMQKIRDEGLQVGG